MTKTPLIRCFACGLERDIGIEMCPRRYLSPHTEEFMSLVGKHLKGAIPKTRDEHNAAIKAALKEYGNVED